MATTTAEPPIRFPCCNVAWRSRTGNLLAAGSKYLYRYLVAAFTPTGTQNRPASASPHPKPETVFLMPPPVVRLEGPFTHCNYSYNN